jgi:hypothetical protein
VRPDPEQFTAQDLSYESRPSTVQSRRQRAAEASQLVAQNAARGMAPLMHGNYTQHREAAQLSSSQSAGSSAEPEGARGTAPPLISAAARLQQRTQLYASSRSVTKRDTKRPRSVGTARPQSCHNSHRSSSAHGYQGSGYGE